MNNLEAVLIEVPRLNIDGICHIGTFYFYYKDHVKKQEELLQYNEIFTKLCEWLRDNITPRRSINTNHTSYNLKHYAEHVVGYTPNGAFIAAAIFMKYPYRFIMDTPNVYFGMCEPDIKKAMRIAGYNV